MKSLKKRAARRVSVLLLLLLVVLSLASPVLADGYAMLVTIDNTGTTSYTSAPWILTIDNDWMVANDFMRDDGLDVLAADPATMLALPTMVADDKTLFAADALADCQSQYYLTTGNDPVESMPIIVGDGGYVTIPDSDTMEEIPRFMISVYAYIDTSSGSGKNILIKPDLTGYAFKLYISDEGEITADLEDGSVEVSADGVDSGLHLITIVADGSSLGIYIDGEEVESATQGENYIRGTTDDWILNQNNVMPYIVYVKMWVLTGDESIPIGNVYDLQLISTYPEGSFKLTNDIDASETSTWNFEGGVYKGFEPIGDWETPFSGHFDGNGHTISNLYINRLGEREIGLFGDTSSASIIENLGLENVYVVGESYVGGLVGHNDGVIRECYTTGYVKGQGHWATDHWVGGDNVGGLVGMEGFPISIQDCYSKADVVCVGDGASYIGGLVGTLVGVATGSYSTGSVTPNNYANFCGGFIGCGGETSASGCYWDIQTSGMDSSYGGTGKTTELMKYQPTFTDWDFTTVWGVDPEINDGYPYLLWLPDELEGITILWYEPTTIIESTTLPDRSELGNDGIITWGTNPITVSATATVSPIDYTAPTGEASGTLPTTTDSDNFGIPDGTADNLVNSPLWPLINMISDATELTELQVWQGALNLLLLVVVAGSLLIFHGHALISGFVGLAMVSFGISMEIYPWGAIVIAVIYMGATLLLEAKHGGQQI